MVHSTIGTGLWPGRRKRQEIQSLEIAFLSGNEMGETQKGCLEEVSHEIYTRSYSLANPSCLALVLCNPNPISSSNPSSSFRTQPCNPLISGNGWLGTVGVGKSLYGKIISRTILSEYGHTFTPFFLLGSLPISLGIPHSFFLFTNPSLLFFGTCPFLLVSLILLSPQ